MNIFKILFIITIISVRLLAQNDSTVVPDSSVTINDSVATDSSKTTYKIGVVKVETDDTEFGEMFNDKLYSKINIVSHRYLNSIYDSMDINLEKKWYYVAEKEKINYILFLNVESPRIRCESKFLLFMSKALVKDVKVRIKVFSVEDSLEVYNGLVETSYRSSPIITLKDTSKILADINDINLYYEKAYDLTVDKIGELLLRMGIYKENYYER